MFRSNAPEDAGSGTTPAQELAPSADPSGNLITIPDADLLFSGDFKRSGHDLILAGHGKKAVIHDYFAHDSLPTLRSAEGAILPGKLVGILAGPEHPGQYALAQPDHVPDGHSAGNTVVGRLETVSGTVTIKRADGLIVHANAGDVVRQGDVVQTGTDGAASIAFADGTVCNLSADARMVLNEFGPDAAANSGLATLLDGAFSFRVPGDTSDLWVDTPVGKLALAGTKLAYEGDIIFLKNGTIALAGNFDLYDHTGKFLRQVNLFDEMVSVRQEGDTTVVERHAMTSGQLAQLGQQYDAVKNLQAVSGFGQQPDDTNTKSTNAGGSSGTGNNGPGGGTLSPFPTFPPPPTLPTGTAGSNSGSGGSGGITPV